MLARNWIQIFILAIIFSLSVMGVINFIVNPYEIFNHHLKKLNKPDSTLISERVNKFYIANRFHPKTIMIGTSRIGKFKPYQLAPYLDEPIYNYSLAGSTIDEQAAYIRYMVDYQHVKTIVWSLDFFAFNPTKPIDPAFQRERLSNRIYVNDYTTSLFNYKTLKKSLSILQSSIKSTSSPHDNPLSLEQRLFKIHSMMHYYATKSEFLKSESFKNPNSINQKIKILKDTIRYCHEHNVTCILYTSPVYYEHIYMLYGIGLGSTFEYWKTSLASIHPYTDFCTVNSITTDAMQFEDSSHANTNVGSLVFNRIFLKDRGKAPKDFGTEITSQNVQQHLITERFKLNEIFNSCKKND